VTALTHDRLLELLSYDPETGVFTHKRKRGYRGGEIAGTYGKERYWMIGVMGKVYGAGRLAWFYVHGVWPTNEIDHKNQVKTDNWIENLRDVTGQINKQNQHRPHKDNKLGIMGVSKNSNRYTAQIGRVKLGYFDTAEEAHQVFVAAKKKLHPEAFISVI